MLPTRIPVSMGNDSVAKSVRVFRAWGMPLFIGAVVVFGLLARDAPNEAIANVCVAFGVAAAIFVLIGLMVPRWLHPRLVSVVRRSGRLVFSPPAALHIAFSLVAGLAMVSVARLWLEPEQWTYLGYYERGAVVLGPLAGALIAGEALWSLRRPAGLTLDERGMCGVRGGPLFDLNWSDVIDVKVAESKKQRSLVLVLAAGGDLALVPEGAVSGDVYAVATIVRYYLEHPDERGRLVDGLDAVRHVDSEVRAGRFSRI